LKKSLNKHLIPGAIFTYDGDRSKWNGAMVTPIPFMIIAVEKIFFKLPFFDRGPKIVEKYNLWVMYFDSKGELEQKTVDSWNHDFFHIKSFTTL